MATHELVSTHMPQKSRVENWLHEYQLLSSVKLPLGGTVIYRDYIKSTEGKKLSPEQNSPTLVLLHE